MQPYTLREAQDRLSELIAAAQHGEHVFIVDEQQGIVQLVPVPAAPKTRHAGSARGLIKMADDFDAPLADFAEYME